MQAKGNHFVEVKEGYKPEPFINLEGYLAGVQIYWTPFEKEARAIIKVFMFRSKPYARIHRSQNFCVRICGIGVAI